MPTDKRQRQKEGQRARRAAAMAAARRRQRRQRLIISLVLAALVVGLISIISIAGGNDNGTNGSTPTTMPKPKVTLPKGPAPTKLVKKDLKVGKGAAVELGDAIEVNYVGVQLSNGKQFDSTWARGQTASYQLVEGGLIDGWTKGIPGMRVGGRRELIVPASMAYGETNPRPGGPSGALLFIIDLVAIN